MNMSGRIASRRNTLGLTLGELSRLCGISPGAISDLEHGRQLTTTKLHHLARALAVTVEWLESGDGPSELSNAQSPAHHHRPQLSQDALLLAAQWDKLAEPARSQARAMVEAFATVQQRKSREQREVTPPSPAQKFGSGN
jgi:transcriptional regulator with XRE-family HTH domain